MFRRNKMFDVEEALRFSVSFYDHVMLMLFSLGHTFITQFLARQRVAYRVILKPVSVHFQ